MEEMHHGAQRDSKESCDISIVSKGAGVDHDLELIILKVGTLSVVLISIKVSQECPFLSYFNLSIKTVVTT